MIDGEDGWRADAGRTDDDGRVTSKIGRIWIDRVTDNSVSSTVVAVGDNYERLGCGGRPWAGREVWGDPDGSGTANDRNIGRGPRLKRIGTQRASLRHSCTPTI